MKKSLISAFLSLMIIACNAQKRKGHDETKTKMDSVSSYLDTSANPKIDVRVNKKYDKMGNLIRYDSTYSYFYSSPAGKMNKISNDSLYNNFKSYFHKNYDNIVDQNLNDVFFNDSLFKYDFFENDYFIRRFEMNLKHMQDLFRQMDSLKVDYLHRGYPKGRTGKSNQPPPSVID